MLLRKDKVQPPKTDGLAARMLSWIRRTVVNLSENSVEKAMDGDQNSAVDFEILLDPSHPDYPEMSRRQRQQQTREDRDDLT